MKCTQLIKFLHEIEELEFFLPGGQIIAHHFHITEVSHNTRHFVDCGGTVRMERNISLQLWVAHDTQHRLSPSRLLSIIQKAMPLIGAEDLDVEVEYQDQSISRYGLAFDGEAFHLIAQQTRCLAEDQCGITPQKPIRQLADLAPMNAAICSPGSGCCS